MSRIESKTMPSSFAISFRCELMASADKRRWHTNMAMQCPCMQSCGVYPGCMSVRLRLRNNPFYREGTLRVVRVLAATCACVNSSCPIQGSGPHVSLAKSKTSTFDCVKEVLRHCVSMAGAVPCMCSMISPFAREYSAGIRHPLLQNSTSIR